MPAVKSKLKTRLVASSLALVLGFGAGVGLNMLGATSALAQSLANASGPAEIPPSNYAGRQYVDSRGCVYVRAGANGSVNWVPRVTRSRKVICGMKPTLANRAAPAQQAAPAANTRVASAAAAATTRPTTTRQVSVAAPTTRRVVAAAPASAATVATTTRRVVASPTVRRVPASPQIVRQQTQTQTQTRRVVPTQRTVVANGGASACPSAPRSSQGYINSGQTLPVRCGPQAQAPYAAQVVAGQARSAVRSNGVIAPQVSRGIIAPAAVPIPEGYRRVWGDDRLNPNRGIPNQVVSSTSTQGVAAQTVRRQAVVPQQPTQRVSAAQPRATAGQYVQVGLFGNAGNAQATARRLQQTGLPVRVGRVTRSGKTYQVVLAGPFGSQPQLRVALNTARRAGFSDAFVR